MAHHQPGAQAERPSLSLPPAIIIFDLARKWSIEFLSNENNYGTYSHFNDLLDHDRVNTTNIDIRHDLILPILNQFRNNTSQTKDFFSDLKDLFLSALDTLQLCTKEQAVDAPTTLATLENLITSISNFTHESLELIGRDAIEMLRELRHRIQELDKDLVKLKVSAKVFNAIFSMIAVGFAAAVSPVTTIAVQPLLQYCFDPLWDVLENPIIEKKKVLETIQFVTHSAIVEAGRIKDIVQGLKILVDDHNEDIVNLVMRCEELEEAMVAAVAQVEMEHLEIRNLMQPLHVRFPANTNV